MKAQDQINKTLHRIHSQREKCVVFTGTLIKGTGIARASTVEPCEPKEYDLSTDTIVSS